MPASTATGFQPIGSTGIGPAGPIGTELRGSRSGTKMPNAPGLGRPAPRVLITTEGNYPYTLGGVSTWCNMLVNGLPEFSWQVLPIMAGGLRRTPKGPATLKVLPPVEIWSGPPRGWRWSPGTAGGASLPGDLTTGLLGWDGDPDAVTESLVWCRRNPHRIRPVFRSRAGWASFLTAVQAVIEDTPVAHAPPPRLAVSDLATLYQAMYWIARTAAVSTPPADVLVVTAAGWAAIPAIVHQALHKTPLLLAEHGVYVRESYMAARNDEPGSRFVKTRLARGLTRAAYARASVVSPVTAANCGWEEALGLPSERIRPIYNGMGAAGEPVPAPRANRVVSVGRLDPIKDIHTLLRAAAVVVREIPSVEFAYYGPSWPPVDSYGRSCAALWDKLDLRTCFEFKGPTRDAAGAVRNADVAVMSSISEALPMAILEAMSEARPVVSTSVGGIPELLEGCGFVAPPGDSHRLAMGIVTLLKNPSLAEALGKRGYVRLARNYSQGRSLEQYRVLLSDLVGG